MMTSDTTGGEAVAPRPRAGRITAVLPALNEADALPAALAGRPGRIRAIVVDNDSTDGTSEVARRLGASVIREKLRGFGAACWAGALAASDAEVIVFMDADATCTWPDAERLADAVLAGEADLAMGWRLPDLREAGAMPWHVAVANRVLGWVCGRLAGVALHDVGPLRAIRRDALLDLGIEDRTYGWPLEMVLRAGAADLRVVEIPVAYRVRVGTSKVTGTLRGTLRAVGRMVVVLARTAVLVRPWRSGNGPGSRSGWRPRRRG